MAAQPGDRVELIRSGDEWTRLAGGARGTVVLVDSAGTVHVAWDDGHRLGLIPEVDSFRLLTAAEKLEEPPPNG